MPPPDHEPDWTTELLTLDLESLSEIDTDELEQPWDATYSASAYGESLNLDSAARVSVAHHHCRDVTGIKSMADAIGILPSPTEAVHLWIGGQHSMGHVIPAVLELAAPAIIERCTVATLTFSKDNAAEWAGLVDAGKIKSMAVFCSQYFQKTSTGIFEVAQRLFEPRGIEVFPRRIHCKLLCLKLSDGRTVTGEGSANTRSARTLEQVCLFGSPEVYAFHLGMLERAKASTKDRNLAEPTPGGMP